MDLLVYILLGALILAIAICAVIQAHIRRRLKSIDGLVGIVRQDPQDCNIVGGQIDDTSKKTSLH
jgi:hypothetical protein